VRGASPNVSLGSEAARPVIRLVSSGGETTSMRTRFLVSAGVAYRSQMPVKPAEIQRWTWLRVASRRPMMAPHLAPMTEPPPPLWPTSRRRSGRTDSTVGKRLHPRTASRRVIEFHGRRLLSGIRRLQGRRNLAGPVPRIIASSLAGGLFGGLVLGRVRGSWASSWALSQVGCRPDGLHVVSSRPMTAPQLAPVTLH
jgi:hypothetical protein